MRNGVLVTRPEPGLTDTCEQLEARGFTPVPSSLFAIAPLPFRQVPTERLQAVLVTSANALSALDPATAPTLLAVGETTAARARAVGMRSVVSAGGDASALVALCRRHLVPKGGPLLLVCGKTQGIRLAADLRLHGFQVIRRVVYAQQFAACLPTAALDALSAGTVAASLFMSASAAHLFARLLPISQHRCLADVQALAISAAAARPVAALPWQSVRVAVRPTAEDVLALL